MHDLPLLFLCDGYAAFLHSKMERFIKPTSRLSSTGNFNLRFSNSLSLKPKWHLIYRYDLGLETFWGLFVCMAMPSLDMGTHMSRGIAGYVHINCTCLEQHTHETKWAVHCLILLILCLRFTCRNVTVRPLCACRVPDCSYWKCFPWKKKNSCGALTQWFRKTSVNFSHGQVRNERVHYGAQFFDLHGAAGSQCSRIEAGVDLFPEDTHFI